ncbi:MAG: TolC family protein, partial [Planctomycetes bacterium]|nr:TolC family protein [Planctomycetota bacterium]
SRVCIGFLERNPRQVKRFDNAFRLQLHVASNARGTGLSFDVDQLIAVGKWVAIKIRWPELALALNAFYDGSIGLAVILHLDSSVTLIPSVEELPPITLVRNDIAIEELLNLAVRYRPDLESVRALVEAFAADKGATWWGAFGPQFAVNYQYGGITGHANNVVSAKGIPGNLILNPASPTGSFSANPFASGAIKEGISRGSLRLGRRKDQTFGFSDQQRFNANMGWRLSLSAFGDLKTADATQKQAVIEAERQLDQVRAQVVRAVQSSKTHNELMSLSRQQVTAAEEALRLTEANLRAGAMTTLDVLQAQDAANQARLRYAEAVVRYNQSQVNLLAALGLLEESSLVPPSDADMPPDPTAPDGE